MVLKQLSVFVENRQGRLWEVTNTLAAHGIDIRALSIADTTDFGILRLIVSRPAQAEQVLREQGFTVSQTDVLGIGIQDQPGGLSSALLVLKEAGIEVEYMYAFISKADETAFVILRVEPIERAAEILARNGVLLLRDQNIY